MKKTFLLGVLLGIGGAVALAGWYPVVDPVRFSSETSVAKNGGRIETFRVRVPEDRIALTAGTPLAEPVLPASLAFPPEPELSGLQVELFRLRNQSGQVVGLASRINANGAEDAGYTDWTLFLPARGALYLSAAAPLGWPYGAIGTGEVPEATETVFGDVVGGAGEFKDFAGSFSEEWLLTGRDEDGRLRGEVEIATLAMGTRP